MIFSFLQVGLICLIYLGCMFALAYATEKGWVPQRLVSHPLVYIFSLGIFASAWSFYGVIDLAKQFGYGALAYYIGTGVLFLFAPLALRPLIELGRRYQINSMADLLTFRYHSHAVGGLVTLCMLLAMAPLLAVQIKAVADTIHILTHDPLSYDGSAAGFQIGSRETLAFIYCSVIAAFAMLFGSNREHHKGLITAMAFESLVKLSGLLIVGGFALFYVFGGLPELDQWLHSHPEQLQQLRAPNTEVSSHTLLLVFVATAVAMPHIFHITVVENHVKHATKTVSWALPLFLLAMALPVFPILWAGLALNSPLPAEYFPLGIPIASGNVAITVAAFVAGLSAATGAIISISLAVATMIMNHWILPATPLRTKKEIYGQLVKIRRVLIAVVVIGGYSFYLSLGNRFSLTDLAITAFIGTLQFLPGTVAVVHWTRGNRRGFISGLFAGMGIWLFGLLLPMLAGINDYTIDVGPFSLAIGIDHWSNLTLWSLGINTVIFMAISHFTGQSDAERYSAELCSEDELSHPIRLAMDVRSPEEVIERLSSRIGESTARKEVERALATLGLNPNERRPYALRRLRDEIEANLSGLLGIALASEIVDRQLPFKVPESDVATDINLMESRLSHFRDELTGLAGDLNNLRLYHRRTLEELPMAVCSVGKDMEVMMWNNAMVELTGIESESVTGSHLNEVLEPWGELLAGFYSSKKSHLFKQEVSLAGQTHWISLHKAAIPSSLAHKVDGQVFMLEDVTELQMLEQELVHSERLASVGRLAAGVAHEIGNPVTGIACLAQNLKYETEDPEVLDSAEQILSQTERVSRIVQSLVSFSHSGAYEGDKHQNVELWECAQEAINLLNLQKEKGQVNFHNLLPRDLRVQADSQRMIQVFVNLLSNARDASPDGGDIHIRGRQQAGNVIFSITDHGTGIPAEIRERVLEPFFTTKEPGEGTGLGLSMVYSIIDDHKGSIDIISPTDEVLQKGTKFVIILPNPLETAVATSNTMSI